MNKPTPRFFRFAPIALAALIATASALIAGPLTPPVGPVAPTGKTTQEVFDRVAALESRIAINSVNTPGDAGSIFRITQPGSYFLNANVTGVAGRNGIVISSSGVTVDLNGFELIGVAGSLNGVVITGAASNVSVRNGSIRFWGARGADAATSGATKVSFTDLKVSFCGGSGIRCHTDAEVIRCMVASNGAEGIFVNGGSTVIGCTATGNAVAGIASAGNSTIIQCTSSNNAGDGFNVGNGSTVSHCTASGNTGNGIRAFTGCTITACTTSGNQANGIFVAFSCIVLNNTNTQNGVGPSVGAGIFVDFSGNRIEGNVCTLADRGIHVISPGNIIIRNTCSGNTISNWTITANNVVGPILDRTAPASAAINGNSAPSSLGTTDPNANFTY